MRALVITEGDAAWLVALLAESRHALEVAVCAPAEAASSPAEIVVGVVPARGAARVLEAVAAHRERQLILVGERLEELAAPALRLGAAACLREQGLAHLGPALDAAVAREQARAERRRVEAFEAGQRDILEAIGAGTPLATVLEQIVLLIEAQTEGMYCSILLLDAEGQRVRVGAAPHLPVALSTGIEGALIGPMEGSCGAAAYLRQPVIVEDVGTHPSWAAYRQLVVPFGLRACWSTPIMTRPEGEVLGTFAMYHREARGPSAREEAWVAKATHLARLAIMRDQAIRAREASEYRYRQIVETAYEGVWLLDPGGQTMFVNQRTAELLGHPPEEIIGRPLVDFMDEDSRARAQGGFLARLRSVRQQAEFAFRRKGGDVFWALLSGSPIHGEDDVLAGALCMLTDISELKRVERILRKREAEARVVFDNAAFGLALLDEEGRVVRSNPALQRFFARSEGELRGQVLFPEVAEALQSGETTQGERAFTRHDGAAAWGRVTASLMTDDDRRHIIVMLEDVSDRKRMEAAVRSSEQLRSLIYGAVTDILFYIAVEPGPRYRFLSVNPAFLEATQLDESAVIGRLVSEVIPAPSLEQVLAGYATAIRERRTVTWDEVTPYPAGLKYGEVTIRPIFDADGACTNLVGSVHDVTERRMAQERLAEQAELLDRASDAILVCDLERRVRSWNKGAERLYGWSAAEARGRDLRELIYPQGVPLDAAWRLVAERGEWNGEVVRTARSGKHLVVDERWTLMRSLGSLTGTVLIIGTDRSERAAMQALMGRTQRLESLGALAGGLAHDFNNVLTVIQSGLETGLRRVAPGDPLRDALDDARSAAGLAAELVRRLLTFSRKDDVHLQRTDLREPVESALRMARGTIPRHVSLATHLADDTPQVMVDPAQIQQVVVNLVANAGQAIAGPAGTIDVHLDRVRLDEPLVTATASLAPATYARLRVVDSGSGIRPADLERIFDPFFTTKDAEHGTGLGLSVVDGIVRGLHGGVVVQSNVGQGTELCVYLPAAD